MCNVLKSLLRILSLRFSRIYANCQIFKNRSPNSFRAVSNSIFVEIALASSAIHRFSTPWRLQPSYSKSAATRYSYARFVEPSGLSTGVKRPARPPARGVSLMSKTKTIEITYRTTQGWRGRFQEKIRPQLKRKLSSGIRTIRNG